MDQRNLTEPELASRARLSLNTLKGILGEAEGTGSGRHHVPNLFALAWALGLPPYHLIEILYGASPEELAWRVDTWSTLEATYRATALNSPEKSGELLNEVDSMRRAAETVLRIAREIAEGGNPAALSARPARSGKVPGSPAAACTQLGST
jgi:hypothetical protein